ncbi:amino acid ABC transporter permease [Bosea sp. NBC_00550]|uniref:amino acid ABC transporter permease n=1 Tax=Bosea sp. NBC_00550 TaxID=2969621 RepID=UPI0022323AC7|nr:amino acid ABC transporter permease [Bosea sp. NBC_00550]UZF92108.1 amino acid ABC transporter permease [Bosea sp. NBC_00550]
MSSTQPARIVPATYWGQRFAVLLLCTVVGWLLVQVARTDNVNWSVIPEYLFNASILSGIRLTLLMTFLAVAIGVAGGIVLAAMKESRNAMLSTAAGIYIWFFRGTPLLVQLIFWFNIQLFIPSVGVAGYSINTNALVSPFTAALLALSLNEAAYMAEIVRGGLLAVDKGQSEAAMALGYTPGQTFRKIILPQAMRVIIPPIGNQTISMLKTTSLVSFVAAQDLLTRVQNIYAKNFLVIELLFVAAIWYLVMTSVATVIQGWIERRLSRASTKRPARLSPRQLAASAGQA